MKQPNSLSAEFLQKKLLPVLMLVSKELGELLLLGQQVDSSYNQTILKIQNNAANVKNITMSLSLSGNHVDLPSIWTLVQRTSVGEHAEQHNQDTLLPSRKHQWKLVYFLLQKMKSWKFVKRKENKAPVMQQKINTQCKSNYTLNNNVACRKGSSTTFNFQLVILQIKRIIISCFN